MSFLLLAPGLFLIKKDFTYKIWHQSGDPLLASFNEFQNRFGNDDSLIIGVTSPQGLFRPEVFRTIKKLSETFWEYKDVARVDTLLNWQFIDSDQDQLAIESLPQDLEQIDYEKVASTFQEDSRAKGNIISKDLKMTLITITAKTDANRKLDYTRLSQQVTRELEKYQGTSIQFTRVGNVTFTDMFEEITFKDLLTLFPMLLIIFAGMLFFMFGNMWSVYFSFVVAGLTILMTLGISGYLGQAFNLVSSATPTILLTVAMADAIHLMTLFFRDKDRQSDTEKASLFSLQKNLGPTLLTSLTTSVGFLSFSNSKILPISILGIQVAIGVAIAWAVSFLLFPVFIHFFPPKQHKLLNSKKINPRRFVQVIYQAKYPIVIGAFFLAWLGFSYTKKLEVNMNAREQFSQQHILNKNIDYIENFFGPSETLELMVQAKNLKSPQSLERVESLERWFLSKNYVNKIESALTVLRELNYRFHGSDQTYKSIPTDQALIAQLFFTYDMFTPSNLNLSNMMTQDYTSMRLTIFWDKYSSSAVLSEIESIKQKAKDLQLDLKVTGKAPIFHNLTPYVVDTFLKSFLIAFIAITLVLMIVLKSIRLGILSLIPNLLPLFLGGMVVYLTRLNFDIGIVMVGAVALGIAVDDSIHFLFNFKRNFKGDITKALQDTITHTFPSLFFTTLILVIGFGSFAIADYIPNALFGSITAMILIIALSADFIVLPACIAVFYGRRAK